MRRASIDKFAARVRNALLSSGTVLTEDLAYDAVDHSFRIRLVDDDLGTLRLDNLYREWQSASTSDRLGVVGRTVGMVAEMLEPEPTEEIFRSRLLVQLRRRSFAAREGIVFRVVAGHLALCLCEDRPDSIRYPRSEAVAAANVDETSAFALARAHLERQSEGALERLPSGVYRSSWKDTYDATRATLPWLIMQVPVTEGYAIGVPNRDTLLVCDLGDPKVLAALIAEIRTAANEPRQVNRPDFCGGSVAWIYAASVVSRWE
jgi:hypothetical protein